MNFGRSRYCSVLKMLTLLTVLLTVIIIRVYSLHIADDNFTITQGNYTITQKHPCRCANKPKQGDF
jgi:hypothetical protein